MRTRINASRLLFGALVATALGFGASTATAASAAAESTVAACPGYMTSATACTDCCRKNYGAVGIYNSSLRYCNCAL